MQPTGEVVCPHACGALTMAHFIRSVPPWVTAQRLSGGRLESMPGRYGVSAAKQPERKQAAKRKNAPNKTENPGSLAEKY